MASELRENIEGQLKFLRERSKDFSLDMEISFHRQLAEIIQDFVR